MSRRFPIVLMLVLAAVILTSCQTLRGPLPLPSPTVTSLPQPIGKPLVVTAIPGLYLAWGSAANAIPPTREPGDPLAPGHEILGIDCGTYLGSGGDVGATGVWDDRNAINWSPYDICLNKAGASKVTLADGRSIKQPVILTLPSAFSDTGSQWYNTAGHGAPGSAGNPFMRLHLPPWMQNDTYRFTFTAPSGKVYQSIRYNGDFKQRMIEFIRAAGQRYNGNPQVAAVRIYVGVQGESQPVVQCQRYWDVVPPAGGDNVSCGGDSLKTVMAEHEKTVSCTDYISFVRDVSQAAFHAFPDKAVLSMVDTEPCSTMSSKSFRKWLYEGQWPTEPIGVSMNNINIDRPDVDERPTNNMAAWSKWGTGRTLRGLGYPMLYEFDAHAPSVEGMYWTVLSAAGNGGNFILYHSPWNGTFSQPMWQVIDYWLGSERRAWLVFRDREYPTYDFTAGYGTSGALGDWGKYLRAVNADDAPQVCAPALAKSAASANATATAGGALNLTPACPEALPTPAITPAAKPSPGPDLLNRLFNRQARRLDPGKVLRITVSGDWPAFGSAAPVETTVSYLDIGTDAFDVVLPGANGRPARHTVQKTGTGIWQQAIWTDNVAIGNLLDGDNFMQIINDAAGVEYLHEVYVTVPEGMLGPAATPTATATVPAPTKTPATPPTSTPTATPTGTFTTAPTLTATLTQAASATAAPSMTPTSPSIVGPSATLTAAHTVTATSTAMPVPTATATQAPSATLVPNITPTIPTATAMPAPTATAVSSVPVPTAIPTAASMSDCPPRPLGSLALSGPRALAAGAGRFYAALFESSQVASFTGDTRVRTWQQPSGAGRTNGLAVWGDTLIASNRDTGTVTLHDAATGRELAVVVVGKLPWGVAAVGGPSGHGAAYVANFADDTVAMVDLVSRQRMTIPVGPMPVTPLVAGDQVLVLHLNGAITRLDLAGNVLGQSNAGVTGTRGIAYDPVRQRLYVGSESGSVIAVDPVTLTPVRRYELPGPVYAVAVNQETGRVFAVDPLGDRLFAIDPVSAAVDVLPLLNQGAGEGGQGLVVQDNRVAVSNFAANSVSFFEDTCGLASPAPGPVHEATNTARPTATSTGVPTAAPTSTSTVMPAPTSTPSVVVPPTPVVVRAKIEIVWPHGSARVEDAGLANVTAYLLDGDGTQDARKLLDSVPCNWEPTVWLWSALNNQPAKVVGVGQKRMVTGGGRNFPAWDFNDIDVSSAQDLANKLSFFVTVSAPGGPIRTVHNVWAHAADARTLFPQQDVPTGVTRARPTAVDSRIEIVWPQDNLPVEEAQRANITAYLFNAGSQQALSPDIMTVGGWTPTVRLHASLNNEPEKAPSLAGEAGVTGVPRIVTGANGLKFLAWDFNDVDVSAANDPLNRLYFWVTVDGVTTYSNIWAHGADARTLFPQPDVLNSCK